MRLKFWIGSGILLVVLFFCIGAFLRADVPSFFMENQRLQLGWSGSNQSGIGRVLNEYKKDVEAKTKEIEIITFYGDRLGEKEHLLEQIRLGQPYLGLMPVGEGSRFSSSMKALNVPILFQNAAEIDVVMNSSIGESIIKELQGEGFQVIGWMPVVADSLWIGNERKALGDLKGLSISIPSESLESAFWAYYGVRLETKPSGLWRSDALLGNIGGLVTSSEWMEEQGLFWQFPNRMTIGGVKPLFFVMNAELFAHLSEKAQNDLIESAQKWKFLNAEQMDQVNIEKMAENRPIGTILLPKEEFGKINQGTISQLDKEQVQKLDEIRRLLGGHFFFETPPPATSNLKEAGKKDENEQPAGFSGPKENSEPEKKDVKEEKLEEGKKPN